MTRSLAPINSPEAGWTINFRAADRRDRVGEYSAPTGKKRLWARFPVKPGVVAREWKTPEEVRATIGKLHRENGVTGVVMIGNPFLRLQPVKRERKPARD